MDLTNITLPDSFSFTIFGTICDLLLNSKLFLMRQTKIENKLVLIIHATFNKCLVINQVKKKKKASEE